MYIVLQGILFHAFPRLSRPEIFFGVNTGRHYLDTDQARAVLLRYRLIVWTVTAATAALAAYWKRPLESGLWMVIQFAAVLFAWAHSHARVKPATDSGTIRTASLRPRREAIPGGILFAAGPFIVLAAAGLFVHFNWDKLPDRIPVHWGPGGAPDRWTGSSFSAVYGMLGVGLFITAMIVFFAYATLRMTRQVRPSGPSSEHEGRFKRLTALILIGSAYLVAFLHAGIAIGPLLTQTGDLGSTFKVLVFAPAVLVILLIAATFWMGQGGSRLKTEPDRAGEPTGDSTPDDCWKWGLFYYNPGDPALLVEKRMGLGWTFNFANGWSWVILGALFIVPLALPRLLR